mgnify:FL=1
MPDPRRGLDRRRRVVYHGAGVCCRLIVTQLLGQVVHHSRHTGNHLPVDVAVLSLRDVALVPPSLQATPHAVLVHWSQVALPEDIVVLAQIRNHGVQVFQLVLHF